MARPICNAAHAWIPVLEESCCAGHCSVQTHCGFSSQTERNSIVRMTSSNPSHWHELCASARVPPADKTSAATIPIKAFFFIQTPSQNAHARYGTSASIANCNKCNSTRSAGCVKPINCLRTPSPYFSHRNRTAIRHRSLRAKIRPSCCVVQAKCATTSNARTKQVSPSRYTTKKLYVPNEENRSHN